jgi:hypothetical protein
MEHHELEALVAAILAAGSLSAAANHVPKAVVERYRMILREFRETGGPVAPPVRP